MTIIEGNSLWQLVERRTEATPDSVFLGDESGRTLTFAEYRDAAERVASGLRDRYGIGADVKVAWQLPTWIESIVLVAALARLEAIQIPILPIYRDREVRFIARQSQPRLLIVPSVWRTFDYEGLARQVATDVEGMEVLVADQTLPEGDPATLPSLPEPPGSPADAPVRWLFFTSGTTSEPKGVMHTDRSIMAAARASTIGSRTGPDDVSPVVFPFTHVGGPMNLASGLMTACKLIAIEAFDPVATSDLIKREGCTLAGAGTVFHLAYLAEHRKRPDEKLFATVRYLPGGGAPKPPELFYELKAEIGAPIISGYGLTESPLLTGNQLEYPDEALAHTEGRAVDGVELKLVRLDGTIAGPGEEGEIRAKAPQMFRGYLDSSLDADAFDDEGFFRTGDLGVRDAEGFVTITGRLKDVIIRKGENIAAKEVEDLLYGHAKVVDAAVIGMPDPRLGERCCAIVVPKDPADPLGMAEMIEYLKGAGLMVQKIPEQLEHVDALPRNPAGKVLKHELRARFAR